MSKEKKRQFTNKKAQSYYDWQEKQRKREYLPDYCIKTLDRVKKEALGLERKEVGSNYYKESLKRLKSNKSKFYRQLQNYENNPIAVARMLAKEIPDDITVDIRNTFTRYTLPAWKKSQGGNEESYKILQYPHQLADYVFRYGCETGLIPDDGSIPEELKRMSMKIVTIGDEYYKWIEKEGREDTGENKSLFMGTVSDNEAYRMLRKYDMDHTYTMCGMPLIFFYPYGVPKETRWKLSSDAKDRIKQMLSDIYGKDNFYFPGVVVALDALESTEERFYELTDRYFRNSPVSAYRFETQQHKYGENFSFACIPFVVRYRHKSAVFNLANIANLFDDDGQVNLLLEPESVYFHEMYEEAECWEDEFLASVKFTDYGIAESVKKDLAPSNGDVFFFEYWDQIYFLDLFFDEVLNFDGLEE